MATRSTEREHKNGISLLSLDAGGPRGISQLEILKHVMDKLSDDVQDYSPQTIKRPCEVFAMIGGTGTGGLIAILLVIFKLTAEEALEVFTDFVNKVLKDVDSNPVRQTEKLQKYVNGILVQHKVHHDTKLISPNEESPACKLLIPVANPNNTSSPIILTNYIDRQALPTNLTIAEAMLATCSSHPTFSPAKVLKDFSTVEYIAADLGLSNPIREVISGAHSAFGDGTAVVCLLSIGCGHPGVNVAPKGSNATSRITFLERIAMDSERTGQDIASQMKKITVYHRLSVISVIEAAGFGSWKEPEDIISQTHAYMGDGEAAEIMDRCVNTLKDGVGVTTLEKLKYSAGSEAVAPELLDLTPNYVERKIPTEFLEKCLLDADGSAKGGSKRVIVTGMGGCGKTQLVRRLIEDHGDLFVSVFFIDGTSKESIKRDLTEHVRALGGAHSQKSFEESMKFLSLPARGGERLLVIDNVDDPNLNISAFLPKWKIGAVIITSRNGSHGQLSPMAHLQLDVMSMDESIELLVRGSGNLQLSDQRRGTTASVAEELGYLPIALVQAASYIFRTGCSTDTYISLLRTSRQRVLNDPATSQIDMRYTTAFAAFDASYSILPPRAQQALHLLSFFHRQRFPIECIGFDAAIGFSSDMDYLDRGEEYERGRDCLKEIFYSDGEWDPAEVESIVSSLRSHSLVTIISTEIARLLQMHSLVHEWARLRISSAEILRFQDGAIRLLSSNAQDSNYSLMQYLQDHVQALSPLWEKMPANDMACFRYILKESGAHYECLKLSETLRLTVIDQLGVEHPSTLAASANLAATYGQLGRYAEAEVLEVEVLKKTTKLLGVEHLDTIVTSGNLALTYGRLGRYVEAEMLEVEVLKQRTKLLGINHPHTILASGNLAATYGQLGRYVEAEVLDIEGLKQRTKLLGFDHPHTILASANLAATYRQLGRYAEAEVLEVEVLKQRTKLLGVDHPDTIGASANLAATYGQLGRYFEAEMLEGEVLKQRTKLLGVDHPDTIQASANLAGTYHELGRYAEAEMLFVEVLKQRTKLLGVDHPDTIRASANLAATYRQLGRHAEAEVLEVEVLKQRTKLLGVDHPHTILASANLAETYGQLGRHSEAKSLQNDVLQRRTRLLGDRHPHTLIAMWSLASTYRETQRRPEALELATTAHRGLVENLGESHPYSVKAAAFLASLTAEQPVDRAEGER